MTRIRIALLFLGISTIFKVVTSEVINNESIDSKANDRIANLEETVLGLVSRFEKMEEKNQCISEFRKT